MRIRIRETGQVLSADDWMAWVGVTYGKSFSGLSLEAIHHFKSDPVLEGPQPSAGEGEVAAYDGVEEINGQWFTKYKTVKDN